MRTYTLRCPTCGNRLPEGHNYCNRSCVENRPAYVERKRPQPKSVECIVEGDALERCSELQRAVYWVIAEFVAKYNRKPSHAWLRAKFYGPCPRAMFSILEYRGLIRPTTNTRPVRHLAAGGRN